MAILNPEDTVGQLSITNTPGNTSTYVTTTDSTANFWIGEPVHPYYYYGYPYPGWYIQTKPDKCPNCGYCTECGRSDKPKKRRKRK